MSSVVDPIAQVQEFMAELKSRKLLAPMCLSTVASDGAPNARFVDLKTIRAGRFVFGTDTRSTKADEFTRDSRISLTAWWEPLQVQVRIRGRVTVAADEMSDKIFLERSRSSRALATISKQSHELDDAEALKRNVLKLVDGDNPIGRPSYWHAYEVEPDEMEILRFSSDRLHVRTRYTKEPYGWKQRLLSP